MSKKKRKPRFLIGFSNPSGMGTTYAKTLRELGYQASYVSYWPHNFGYEKPNLDDFSLNLDKKPKIFRPFYVGIFFLKALFVYDVFFFLYGDTFWFIKSRYFPNLDLPILKLFGKKVAMAFVGCDIRKYRPDAYCCRGCQIKCNNSLKRNIARGAEKYANLILTRHACADFLTNKNYLRCWAPLNLKKYKPNYIINRKPLILHAPSDRGIKGTKYIQSAITRLKKEGFQFRFKILENKSHDQVIRELNRADIVVDSLFGGWYGIFAAESMAHGKVVLGYIDPENIKQEKLIPPVISVNQGNIYKKLKQVLIMKPKARLILGKKARQFIENHHDERKIVLDIIEEIY